jgi:hypothetical protein
MGLLSSNNYEGNLKIVFDGFFWKNSKILYSDVNSIDFIWKETTQSTNGIRTGTTENITLDIVTSNETINIQSRDHAIFYGKVGKKSESLRNMYDHIRRETLESRLEFYKMQIKKSGYFLYNGFMFFPPDKVVYNGKEYLRSDYKFMKDQSTISLEPKVREKRSWWQGSAHYPSFSTTKDRDIFFYLLETEFNMIWK